MSGIDIEKHLVKPCLEWDLTIAVDYTLPTSSADGGKQITYLFRRSPNESRYYDKHIGRRTKRIWTQTKVIDCYRSSTPVDILNFLDMHFPFPHFEEWCLEVREVSGIRVLNYNGDPATDEWMKQMRDETLPKIQRFYDRQKKSD